MKEQVIQYVKSIEPELNKLSKEIYDNPELGNEEFNSCRLHIEILKKYGFIVEENFCGVKTGFKATYKSEKPGITVAYLSEYDALPVMGHGCGHNLLGTTSTGAGIVLKHFIDKIGGTVVVLGTPAEETSGAKVTYVDNGVFDDIDIVMISHPGNENSLSGTSLALMPIQFEFHGKTAHAAAHPEMGVNALDAAIQTFNAINALRQQVRSDSRIHGIIKNGGEAANTIPDYTCAQFYVRSTTKQYNEKLTERVKNCARAAALATGCTLDITKYEFSYDDLVTNKALMDVYEKYMYEIGKVKMNYPRTNIGSVDAGNVSHVCPTIHPFFDITNDASISAHTVEMRDCTLTDYAKQMMVNVIATMVLTAIEINEDKDLFNKIKEEFENNK